MQQQAEVSNMTSTVSKVVKMSDQLNENSGVNETSRMRRVWTGERDRHWRDGFTRGWLAKTGYVRRLRMQGLYKFSQGQNIQRSFCWRPGLRACDHFASWNFYFIRELHGVREWTFTHSILQTQSGAFRSMGNKDKSSRPNRGRNHKDYIKISVETPRRQLVT